MGLPEEVKGLGEKKRNPLRLSELPSQQLSPGADYQGDYLQDGPFLRFAPNSVFLLAGLLQAQYIRWAGKGELRSPPAVFRP